VESIKEVITWRVGNVEIADIRWKLIHHLTGVHPAKKNANFLTIPVIHRIVRLKESIKEYKKREKWPRTRAVKSPRNLGNRLSCVFIPATLL
jgi:hypothetical protein